MLIYNIVKIDDKSSAFRHKTNIGQFTTLEKAQAFQAAEEIREFDSGSLAGISFYIETWTVQ